MSDPLTRLWALVETWLTAADERKYQMEQAANAHHAPGEDINRAEMLCLRECAANLTAALDASQVEQETPPRKSHLLPFGGDKCMRCGAQFYADGGMRGVECLPQAQLDACQGEQETTMTQQLLEKLHEARWAASAESGTYHEREMHDIGYILGNAATALEEAHDYIEALAALPSGEETLEAAFRAGWREGADSTDKFGEQHSTPDEDWATYRAALASPTPPGEDETPT